MESTLFNRSYSPIFKNQQFLCSFGESSPEEANQKEEINK